MHDNFKDNSVITHRQPRLKRLILALAFFFSWLCQSSLAQEQNAITISHPPRIAIVLDDLGSQLAMGLRAISIPRNGPITYAVLPYTPYGKRLAKIAHQQNDEVILHLPMEPLGNHTHEGMLTHEMQRQEVIASLRDSLDEIPHINGFNNHMGSLLTQQSDHMRWIMEEISLNTSLFFLDSRTSSRSVAYKTAKAHDIPSLKRDVFLDSIQSIEFVEKQFGKLLTVAMKQGYAIGIGHPYPETLLVLEKYLPTLNGLGFELVTLSDILNSPTTFPYHYAAKSGSSLSMKKISEQENLIFSHQTDQPELANDILP